MTDQPVNTAYPQPEMGIEPDDLDTKMIVAIGLVSTALLVASVLGVTSLVDQFQAVQVEEKVYSQSASLTYGSAESELTNQANALSGYAKPTANKPGYSIPIDRAKDLVLKDLIDSRGAKN